MCNIASWWEIAIWHRELNPVLCDDLEGRGVGEREARKGGKYMHIYG